MENHRRFSESRSVFQKTLTNTNSRLVVEVGTQGPGPSTAVGNREWPQDRIPGMVWVGAVERDLVWSQLGWSRSRVLNGEEPLILLPPREHAAIGGDKFEGHKYDIWGWKPPVLLSVFPCSGGPHHKEWPQC